MSVWSVVAAAVAAHCMCHGANVYTDGETVAMECTINVEQGYTSFPVCFETDLPLAMRYGRDHALYCGLEVNSELYDAIKAALLAGEAIPCRIAVRAGDRVHVPVSLPLWGLIDGDHMHINNRVDVHMYTQAGAVVGAGIAAVRDHLQYVKVGNLINLHGAVRWVEVQQATQVAVSKPTPAPFMPTRVLPACEEGRVSQAILFWFVGCATGAVAMVIALRNVRILKRFVFPNPNSHIKLL